jgi:hypothetical protein
MIQRRDRLNTGIGSGQGAAQRRESLEQGKIMGGPQP